MSNLGRVALAVLCMVPLFAVTAAVKAEAGCHFVCSTTTYTTSPGGGNPSNWGMANDCGTAKAQLSSNLFNEADNHCLALGFDGVCGTITEVQTNPGAPDCIFNGTMLQADGYADHHCGREVCIDRDPLLQ